VWLVHAAALVVVALLLVSAGQPLFTEDTWWHLSMGEAYLEEGPWLAADPLLHTATGAPAPAAWLSGVALHAVERGFGFQGLRVAHALAVAAILILAWSTLRRAADSAVFASLGTLLFANLSAYRLFQLRPHLFTILASLLLFRWLLERSEPPSWRRVAAATALLALWANLHGGFLLGPLLLAAGVAGVVLAAWLRAPAAPSGWRRARRLAAALGLGLLATLLNPTGARPHWLYFAAGGETPGLELIADEWSPLHLLQLPPANLPPSPLAWAVVWGLLLAAPCAVWLQLRRRRHEAPSPTTPAPDSALLAVAGVSAAALLSAVRLLWLGLFPLLLVGRCVRALGTRARGSRPAPLWSAALAAWLLVLGFVRLGDWPMISNAVERARYAQPYAATKYDAYTTWFLRDAQLEGNLFNDYRSGNFLGYWLAPRMRVFVNGSLNVPKHVMDAREAIRRRASDLDGESFVELLDRYHIDVFFGAGMPVVTAPNRPVISTTTHLERTPGWILVYRNVRTAVYLRNDERNRSNLERVAAYYAREGVPFDPALGFDTERVIREAPRWALENALVPIGFAQLERLAASFDPLRSGPARERLASLYAVLGLYEHAAKLDRRRLQQDPRSVTAARRLLWSLLHLGRVEESLEAAERLEQLASPDDPLSRLLVSTARRYAELPEPERAALVAPLPVFTPSQVPWMLGAFRPPEARLRR